MKSLLNTVYTPYLYGFGQPCVCVCVSVVLWLYVLVERLDVCDDVFAVCVWFLISRDGSYGLLRRPIRYNTLLIRNTRIIRERIFAILGGTLGLHQPPSNHHELSPQPPEHYNASW